jgi:hypothetical protein
MQLLGPWHLETLLGVKAMVANILHVGLGVESTQTSKTMLQFAAVLKNVAWTRPRLFESFQASLQQSCLVQSFIFVSTYW